MLRRKNPLLKYDPKDAVKLTPYDSKRIISTILTIISALETAIQIYYKAKESYYIPKKQWRDQIISEQKQLLEIAKNTKDPTENKLIIESILDFSNKIIKLAEYDFTAKKTNNPFLILLHEMNRKIDIDGKKLFWLETFDKQNDILHEASKESLDIFTKIRIDKLLIRYCDLVLSGFDTTLYKDSNTKKSAINQYKTDAITIIDKINKLDNSTCHNQQEKKQKYIHSKCMSM